MRAFAAVTAAYWAFMLTDGALRMLVLLHFHALGFTPVQLAWLFLLYEVAGIVTNLAAGWLGTRFGLAATLKAGLALQVLALAALTALDPAWAVGVSVAYVMAVQGLSGVAKDLSKTAAKSAVKALTGEGALFRRVAALTGSKNAIKGLGFFLGAALLAGIGFEAALWAMAALLAAILAAIVLTLPPGLPGAVKGARLRQVLSPSRSVNGLSLARMFLFGARDAWFVVGLPVFLVEALAPAIGEGSAFFVTGGFMALWIVGYGAVQGVAPALLRAGGRSVPEIAGMALNWARALTVVTGLAVLASTAPEGWRVPLVLAALLAFGAVFALNSSLHSYLILAFAGAGRTTMDVGFYYMANAAGRLIGTLASGLAYQWGGLPGCLSAAAILSLMSMTAARRLPELASRSHAA
ncbi:MAG: organoarsenical effux MFS transporter ArsJ [Hasllibacter sp.]